MDLPSWLDAPKIAGLTVLVLAFVQYLKVYIPEKYIKLFAIGIGIVLSILCELYIGAVMNWVKAVVNGAVASIVADLGYSFLSKTGAKFALPSKTELTNNEKKGGKTMKRTKFLPVLAILMLVALASCASLIKTSYVALNSSKDFYDISMKSVADLQAQGLIDQTKRAQINVLAKAYKEAHNLAVDALATYAATNSVADKDKLLTAMTEASKRWAQVAVLINAIRPNTVPQNLTK